MIRMIRAFRKDERGQTLALMAVMIAGVMSVLALAVDFGMLVTAHTEAQRAADAAALAGAREFLLVQPAAAAAGPARASALANFKTNAIRNVLIDTSEVQVQVDVSRQHVWVRVERQGLNLWFAKLFGKSVSTVNAAAAAIAAPAGTATCVAPWAVSDIWGEPTATAGGDDVNNNGLWDPGEQWNYGDDSAFGEIYNQYASGVTPETGYGSTYRNGLPGGIVNDEGREMVLKVQDPHNSPVSGFFYPFRIGNNTGANDYRNAITGCDTQVVPLNTNVPLEMGNMVGPTRQAVTDLVAMDPNSHWDTSLNKYVASSAFPGLSSPRLKAVPLYHPNYINLVGGGNHNLVFNNFAVIFVEGVVNGAVYGQSKKDEFVIGRFMYYAQGLQQGAPGGATGPLVRVLQLVE